ncbi:MAG: SDR family oxidoreductase [Sporolactobacillus sp.]
MKLGLENKVALVLASSQGLGEAVAEALVREGTSVMITSRSTEKLRKVAEKIGKIGKGRIHFYPADITDYVQIKELVQRTHEKFGKIDILVNNAGGPPSGNFEDFSDEEWEKSFHLNLLSYIRAIHEVLPDLKKEGGRIINIASSSIKQPIPGLILSNTFRMGIVGLSKTLANELAADRILVNTIAPGRIATERVHYLDKIKAQKQGATVANIESQSRRSIPLKRYGTPQEFANAVVFLASDASSYITGSSILVDGGKISAI